MSNRARQTDPWDKVELVHICHGYDAFYYEVDAVDAARAADAAQIARFAAEVADLLVEREELLSEKRDFAEILSERTAAQQEIQTLQEGLTWALDALEERMRNSPTPPLPSEAPMTETPTETMAERAALVAYYDARRASYQTDVDAMAVLGSTVRVLTDAQVLDEHQRLVLRNR